MMLLNWISVHGNLLGEIRVTTFETDSLQICQFMEVSSYKSGLNSASNSLNIC